MTIVCIVHSYALMLVTRDSEWIPTSSNMTLNWHAIRQARTTRSFALIDTAERPDHNMVKRIVKL